LLPLVTWSQVWVLNQPSKCVNSICHLFLNLSERALDSRSIEQRSLLCIMLFFGLSNLGDEDIDSCMIFLHQPLLIFLLSLGWWINVHWRYRLKFFLDGLCLLAAWRRVVQLMIRHPSWWSRKKFP
jgi:hypothetical protein